MDALCDAPVHARRTLFGTLVESLGEDSLAIMSALLLRRAVSVERGDDKKSSPGVDEEVSSVMVDFVHQTVHCSGAQAQVREPVQLVIRSSCKGSRRSRVVILAALGLRLLVGVSRVPGFVVAKWS